MTLAGPGGVGKTRLAIEVAHRMAGVFAHDICFVELSGVADERSVDDAVAAALHLPTNTGRSSTGAILDYLRDKTMLLVLDNCEHLVKACARLVQTLCRDAAGLTVLATSRIPLRIGEEHVVRLEPFVTPTINEAERLTVPDALRFDSVQLFTDRAAQSLLQFTLTEANVLAVVRICQQLDGIPLAIEIAAAQARALPIEAIAERLGQRFDWLNRQVGETLPRQRTLHTLIDWSYELLSARERSVLCRLAVFAGGWTLEAAEAVSTPGEPCAEILAELVDHSLVVFGADAEHQRYSMHETIRQFAQEQLRGSDQEADALERHARYYAQLVSHTAENRAGQTLPERLRTIVDDHDNVRPRVRMVGCARWRAGAGFGRAVGHTPGVLGTGWLFPGRAPLAPARLGGHPGGGFAPAGVRLAGSGRAVLGDHRFRVWVAVRSASSAVVSATWRSAGGDRRPVEVLRSGWACWQKHELRGAG